MDGINSSSGINDAMPALQHGANAYVTSQLIWLEGMQGLSKTVADMAQAHLNRSLSHWTALSGVKSIPEALEVQKRHAAQSMDDLITCTGKLTGASMVLCQRAMAPLAAQVTHALQKQTTSAV